jgi:type II secretion system protein G
MRRKKRRHEMAYSGNVCVKSGKRGFTLVELIVVIIIVGILATVAIPMMSANTDRAKRTEAVAALGALRTAQRLYKMEYTNYANSLSNLSGYISSSDLDGKYYNNGSYTVNNTAAATPNNYGSIVNIDWASGNLNGG